eukprot:gene2034-2724_t
MDSSVFTLAEVLRRVHPNALIQVPALRAVCDIVSLLGVRLAERASTLGTASLGSAKVGAEEGATQFIITGFRTSPRAEYLVERGEPGAANWRASWEARADIIRARGSSADVEAFDALSATDQKRALRTFVQKTCDEMVRTDSDSQYYIDQLTDRDMQCAVKLVLSEGDLTHFALDEGERSVTSFFRNRPHNRPPGTCFDSTRWAGLVFPVPLAGRLLATVSGRPLGEAAPIYLAGVMEYICAEVLLLAGNQAGGRWGKAKDACEIACVHLHMSIHNDKELGSLFASMGVTIMGVTTHGGRIRLYDLFTNFDRRRNKCPAPRTSHDEASLRYVTGASFDGKVTGNDIPEGSDEDVVDEDMIKQLQDVLLDPGPQMQQNMQPLQSQAAGSQGGEAHAAGSPTDEMQATGSQGGEAQAAGSQTVEMQAAGSQGGEGQGGRGVQPRRVPTHPITDQALRLIAARAGVLAFDHSPKARDIFESLRSLCDKYLRRVVYSAVHLCAHHRRCTDVLGEDVLKALAQGPVLQETKGSGWGPHMLCGSGLLEHMLLGSFHQHGPCRGDRGWAAAAAAVLQFQEKEMEKDEEQEDEEGEEDNENEADEDEEDELMEDEDEEDAVDTPAENCTEGDEEMEARQKAHRSALNMLQFERQRHGHLPFAFLPFAGLVAKIGSDFKRALRWDPVAIWLLAEDLHACLIAILDQANMNAQDRQRTHVHPRDIRLAAGSEVRLCFKCRTYEPTYAASAEAEKNERAAQDDDRGAPDHYMTLYSSLSARYRGVCDSRAAVLGDVDALADVIGRGLRAELSMELIAGILQIEDTMAQRRGSFLQKQGEVREAVASEMQTEMLPSSAAESLCGRLQSAVQARDESRVQLLRFLRIDVLHMPEGDERVGCVGGTAMETALKPHLEMLRELSTSLTDALQQVQCGAKSQVQAAISNVFTGDGASVSVDEEAPGHTDTTIHQGAATSAVPTLVADKARHALVLYRSWKDSRDAAKARTEEAAREMQNMLVIVGSMFAADAGGVTPGMPISHAAAAQSLEAALTNETTTRAASPPVNEMQAAGSEMVTALLAAQAKLEEVARVAQSWWREFETIRAAEQFKQSGELRAVEDRLKCAQEALEGLEDEHEECKMMHMRAQRRRRDPPEAMWTLAENFRRARGALLEGKGTARAALSSVMAHHSDFPELLRYLQMGVPDELVPLWDPLCTLEDFDVELLQESSYGRHEVFRGRKGDSLHALKVFRVPENDPERLRVIWREASLLHRLRHPAIVPLLSIFLAHAPQNGLHHIVLKLPFYEHGQLGTWVQGESPPDDVTLRQALLRVLEAVAHLHWNAVVHCDIKPENILVDGFNRTFLADFDISIDNAARTTRVMTPLEGTAGYVAPELRHAGAAPNSASDMYALGKTIETAVAGQDHLVGEELLDLIRQLTVEDPAARPSAAQACSHAYFTTVADWRRSQSRTCIIGACKGRWQLSDGVECANQLSLPHFVCRECLQGYCDVEVQANSTEQLMCPRAKTANVPRRRIKATHALYYSQVAYRMVSEKSESTWSDSESSSGGKSRATLDGA